jgi:hypothetical protein
MFVESREVTTFCPRCFGPIIWAVRGLDDDVATLDVSDWACDCELSDVDWSALAQQATAVFEDMSGEAIRVPDWAVGACGLLAAQNAGIHPW